MNLDVFKNQQMMTAIFRLVIVALGAKEAFSADQITALAGAAAVFLGAVFTMISHSGLVPKRKAAEAVLKAAKADPDSDEAAARVGKANAGKF